MAKLDISEALSEKLATIPSEPGVYLFKDGAGAVIYVGKAVSLRSRVRSYFGSGDSRPTVEFLRARIADVDTIVTTTNTEAVLLENNLIKKHQPRYNIQLRDDKDYVSLTVNVDHPWPMVSVVRRPKPSPGLHVYGPYASAGAVRETLDFLRRTFPLRTCSDHTLYNRTRPCLEYQIKRCVAPCVGYVEEHEYRQLVHQVELFLRGQNTELVRELRDSMKAAADALEFEKAAFLRDRLFAVEKTLERQRVFAHGGGDRDVFGYWREGDRGVVQVLTIRGGQLTGSRGYPFREVADDNEALLSSFLMQYYAARDVPAQVILPLDIEDREVLAEILAEERGKKVELIIPQRGEKNDLVGMAMTNARLELKRATDEEAALARDLESVARALNLPDPPHRMECVDLSNISGTNAVGAVVTFIDGKPATEYYRHYRIRDTEEINDYNCMREVLERRFRRALESTTSDTWEVPDLLVVDGGRGQVSVAVAVLEDLGLPQVPVAGVAKARDEDGTVRRGRARAARSIQEEDRVFVPKRSNPVSFRSERGGLFLLQRLRDEAHRFAITYHRKRRKKSTLRSALDDISGIGPAKRKALLAHFGSVKAIAEASEDDLTAVPGLTRKLAKRIREHLNRAQTGSSDAK